MKNRKSKRDADETAGGERLLDRQGILRCAEGKARCKVQTGVPDGGMDLLLT